ncbi:MAG: aryl-sulfate sulfotransferase [Anaerolineales bacterium]|nr:aryl-sulfate sulfotransferase [Anaerolineales bacterium]MCB8950825.1 aryl-sulfate sulfotransferase [Ardenticatenales bacterium]
MKKWLLLFVLLGAFVTGLIQKTRTTDAANAGTFSVQLTPDIPSGQLVGTIINWTVTADPPGNYEYRFSYLPYGDNIRLMYDFQESNVFEWALLGDGAYMVVATVRDRDTGETVQATHGFYYLPRTTTEPVVSESGHPLTALYSAAPCPAGQSMRVIFWARGTNRATATNKQLCDGVHSMNFYIAGMYPTAFYWLRHETFDAQGNSLGYGPPRYHITRFILYQFLPPNDITIPPNGDTSLYENLILHSAIIGTVNHDNFPYATDLLGRPMWGYLREFFNAVWLLRPMPGGTFTIILDGADRADQVLREVDLNGNVVRQTNIPRINEQLADLGLEPATSFHHDATLLPNGDMAIIASTERILVDVQGPGPVDVIGDYVIVLDPNWQVKWAWDSFAHLDPARAAVLGETCVNEGPGCPPVLLDDIANDWTHSNSVTPTPDGHLLLSIRHQDWVVKINYANGAGDGTVFWHLGPAGDFDLGTEDDTLWNTHQHDAHFISENQIILYDNGNTRCAADAQLCYSRGQVFQINEANMTASLVLNANLGTYAFALGSAQTLANGNYHFDSGIQTGEMVNYSLAQEVLPDGTLNYELYTEMPAYRSFRVPNLYLTNDPVPLLPLIER